jgi:Raf kinase inhibitor-like YbhB/YbcL family protein
MRLESPAFADGERIPSRYTCDSDDVSPPLRWADAPAGTRSFAIACVSPDTPLGTWRHWGVYNIPADVNRLEAGCPRIEPCPPDATPANNWGIKQAVNDFGAMGYNGPCPPTAGREPHHYRFLVWALDVDHIDLPPAGTCLQLENLARPHLLEEAVLVGRY